MNDELMKNGIEIRAWASPRIYSARKPKPSATMRAMIAQTIVRECDEVIAICERMERLRSEGRTQSTEYRWLRLDLGKAQLAIDNAKAVERRAFPEAVETR
jgi:hypothetical protein